MKKRIFKGELTKALWRIWDSYINMICRLIGSTKAFAFDVGTVLFIVGTLSETGWLIVFGAFVGGNIAEKSKWMNGKLMKNDTIG